MKRIISILIFALLLVVGVATLLLANMGILSIDKPYIYKLSSELPPRRPVVAFEHVNLVPMGSEEVVENQTLIVRDGVIEAIGDSQGISIPGDALVIDGAGKYLMPGLVDMHVHIEFENDLVLFATNGVTSVRNMWGNTGKKLLFGLPDQLELRELLDRGELFGPMIYTTGPVMEGSPAFHPLAETFDSVEAAEISVTQQKQQGYEFVKVYDHLSLHVYQAISASARQNNLPVVGHVPFDVGLDSVLENGQFTIEHLTGYIDPDTVEFIIPEDQLDEYAVKTHHAGVWNTVTLGEYPKSKQSPEGFERLQTQPGMDYVSPGTRLLSPFLYLSAGKSHTYNGEDYPERIAALNRQMVQALNRAGAGILLGTDSAQAYHLPGFSIYEELDYLVDAGLSPYEALAAGTRSAAEALGKLDEFGTLEAGKRADLILVNGNPLENVSNVSQRSGVMLRGQWYSEDQLMEMLAGLKNSYSPTFFERTWPLVLMILAVILIFRRINRTIIIKKK